MNDTKNDRFTIAADRADITIHVRDDDSDIAGSFASDSPEDDARIVAKIRERLQWGDPWAWALVEVRATLAGVSGSAWLGGCSYDDEADFRADGYFADMAEEARDALANRLREIDRAVEGK